jgi:integrase
MTSIPFTKEHLEHITITSNRYYVRDKKTPGLRLAIHPSGKKTYYFGKRVNGQWRQIKIGSFQSVTIEQARHIAKTFNSKVTLGSDPYAEKKAARLEVTVRELSNLYYKNQLVPNTKRPRDNMLMLERHFLPKFGHRKVNTITPDEMKTLHNSIREVRYEKAAARLKKLKRPISALNPNEGKANANRVIHVVGAMFKFGMDYGYVKDLNPCKPVKKFKVHSRDRFLRSGELRAFFAALDEEEPLFQDYFQLLLFTGARKSNVLMMRYADIDLELKQWRISPDEAKNRDVNFVMLSDLAIEIIARRKKANEEGLKSPFVFPGDGAFGYLIDPKRSFDRIKERMGVSDIRIHDLRRTLASYMAINGTSLLTIGAALNHKSQVSTAIYARLSQAPVLTAVNAAAAFMKEYS